MKFSYRHLPEIDFDTIQAGERSPGIHLSDVIREVERMLGRAKQGQDDKTSQSARLQFEKGFLWESIFSYCWARRYGKQVRETLITPGEKVVDGIACTIDFLDINDYCLIECKATARSINKLEAFETNFWTWLVQVKAYLYVIRGTHARMPIIFLCGNYKPPFPQAVMVELEFSPSELQDNWAMLRNTANQMRQRGWKRAQ